MPVCVFASIGLLSLLLGATNQTHAQFGVQPIGACCNFDNTCSDGIAEAACEAAGGVYRGDGSQCAAVSCGGACCFGDATCSITSQANCLSSYGSYLDGGTCAEIGPCPICQPEDPDDRDLVSGPHESCTLSDANVNPGCSSGAAGLAEDFTAIGCNQTVCGSADFGGGSRDTDWFHISVAQETEMLIMLENGMLGGATLQFRFLYYPNQQIPPAGTGDGTPCSTVGALQVIPNARGNTLPAGRTVFPLVVPPGVYTMMVAYDFNTPGAPIAVCPSNYRVTFDCASTPCAFQCEAGAVNAESEAGCGSLVQANLGCSGIMAAEPFTPLELGQKTCGDVSLLQSAPGSATRDVDWYSIQLPSGDYVLSFEGEFHAVLLFRSIDSLSVPNCTNTNLVSLTVPQCTSTQAELTGLAAGTYAAFVAPDFGSYAWMIGGPASAAQEICPAPYQLRIAPQQKGCMATCGDSNCDGFVTVGDIGFFVDAIVGGETGWAARFLPGLPACDYLCVNDTNGDDFVTVGDIASFVAAVTGTPCQ